MRLVPLLLSVALIGALASYIAEPSAPGDALYAVKVRVSEPVRILFSITAESRITRTMQYAERRIEEAEKLAADDRLGASTAEGLVKDFGTYARTARTDIDAMMAQNPVRAAELNVSLTARLAAHGEIIQAMMQESQSWRASLPVVADAVEAQLGASTPPDLYAIGKKANEQQLIAMARRTLEVRRSAESATREATAKTGASGIDAVSLVERFVGHADELADTSRQQYETASQRVDTAGADAVYIALATSLSAALEAQSYAHAAIDLMGRHNAF